MKKAIIETIQAIAVGLLIGAPAVLVVYFTN